MRVQRNRWIEKSLNQRGSTMVGINGSQMFNKNLDLQFWSVDVTSTDFVCWNKGNTIILHPGLPEVFGFRSLVFGLWCVDTLRISNLTQNEHDEYYQYIYSQFQETLSVEIQLLDWMRRVMQKFIVLSVLISACLSRAFRHSYFRSCKCKTRDTAPRTTLLCLYTSCLIIIDNSINEKVLKVLCL